MFEALLEENPINPELYDSAVRALSDPSQSERANDVLVKFVEREDAFSVVEPLIAGDFPDVTKLSALVILRHFICENWTAIDEELQKHFCELSKTYFEQFINEEKSYPLITQVSTVIIEILKFEWPHNWPTFITDAISLTESNPSFVIYVLDLLNMLGYEVTNFKSTNILASRLAEMHNAYKQEAQAIFSFMESVFSGDFPPEVIRSSISLFKTLCRTSQISELIQTPLFESICTNLFTNQEYTIQVLSVVDQLTEGICSTIGLNAMIVSLFQTMTAALSPYFPEGSPSETVSEADLDAITFSLTNFVSQFNALLEIEELSEQYSAAMTWILSVIENGTANQARVCYEMFLNLARKIFSSSLMRDQQILPLYDEAFKHVKRLLVFKMDDPLEIIMDYDDNDISQPTKLRTESTTAFFTEKRLMIYMTNIDKEDTIGAFTEALEQVTSADPFDADAFHSVCWAIGSIQQTFTEAEETQFISEIISGLLQTIEAQTDIEMKASIATGLIYICSQYTRFLNRYVDLLYSVMTKLIEFTTLGNKELQDSAVRAMYNISLTSQKNLATATAERPSFLDQVLENFAFIFEPMTQHNTFTMYEVLGLIVQGTAGNESVITHYVELLTAHPLQVIAENAGSPQPANPEAFQVLYQSLVCIERSCNYFGSTFIPILKEITPSLANLYLTYSSAGTEFANAEDFSFAGQIRAIKQSVIGIFENTVKNLPYYSALWEIIAPLLFEHFLPEFSQSNPCIRVPSLMKLVSSMCSKYKEQLSEYVSVILEQLYLPTVEMIKEDFADFVPFRIALCEFIRSFNISLFLINIPMEAMSSIIDCLKWLCNHPQPEISDVAIYHLIDVYSTAEMKMPLQNAIEFENTFCTDILLFAFQLMTDSVHRFAFDNSMDLARKLLNNKRISAKIPEILEPLSAIFTRINVRDLYTSITYLASISSDSLQFKKEIRTFLVEERQFSPRDPALVQTELKQIKEEIEKKDEDAGIVDAGTGASEEQTKKMNDLAMFISGFSLH